MSGAGESASDQGDAATGTGSGGDGMSNKGGDSSPNMPPGDAEQSDSSAAETACSTSAERNTSQAAGKNGLRADGDPAAGSPDGTMALSSEGDPQGKIMAGEASLSSIPDTKSQIGTANETGNSAEVEANACEARDETGDSSDEWGKAPQEMPDDVDTMSEIGRYRYRKIGGNGRVSTSANRTQGGVTAEMKKAGVTTSLIKQARATLARLVDGGETQAGPRWDWGEFSKRLKTFRPVYPARKIEDGRPAILVLADVSGSCSAFSEVSLMVAQAVAWLGVAGSDVVIVSHSNGYPQEWQVNGGKPRPVDWPWGKEAQSWYEQSLRKYQIEAVVALGDWDAEWLYHWLAERPSVRRLVWLDNWSSSVIEPSVRRDLFKKAAENQDVYFDTPWHFESPWSARARGKSTYVVGCGTAEDFLSGLKLAL